MRSMFMLETPIIQGDDVKVSTKLFYTCVLLPSTVFAQEDASRLEKRFEKPPEPKSTAQPLVLPIQEQLAPSQASQVPLILKQIQIVGNTAFSLAELQPIYESLLNKNVSLVDVYRIRDAITAKYGNSGYGLSKAIIPEQKIQADGVVRINILEGFIDEVVIEGANAKHKLFFDRVVAKIKSERPLNAKNLERYLLLANERYALKVSSTLKKSEQTPAASTLILRVDSAPPIDASIAFDNRGTEMVGPTQINGNITVNGLMGWASQTELTYVTTQQSTELQQVSVAHTEVLTPEGLSLRLEYNVSKSVPDINALRVLEQTSDSQSLHLKLSYPFIRTRQENLTGHIKFDKTDTTSKSLGFLASQDKLRSLRLGLAYDRADAYDGINQALLEFSFGMNGLGASDPASPLKSRTDGKVAYQKLTFNLSRKQELGYFADALGNFSVNATLMGQYSGSGLLSSEECGLGGLQFGRAYDSSEILGDSCLVASFELRYAPGSKNTFFKYLQYYGFYDGGYTRNENALSATDPLIKSLSSTGLGLRFGVGNHVSGSVEIAQPLTRLVANTGNKDPRAFANLTVRY